MGERDYGAIARGLRDLPELEDLEDGPRAALLSAWWLADYFGCFDRDPRVFGRKSGWPRSALTRLDAHLSVLEDLGVLESWVGSSDGRAIWVGHIVGYHGFDGLPRSRRDPAKRPKGGSEYPGPDEETARRWERPVFPPDTPGSPAGSLPANLLQTPATLPAESRSGPHPVPRDSRGASGRSRAAPA